MKNLEQDFYRNEDIEQDIERRITNISNDNYNVGSINIYDKLAMLIIGLICIVGMVWGYY